MKSRAFITSTVLFASAAAAIAVVREGPHLAATLAFLAAAAVIGELLEVRSDPSALDGGASHAFSFSSGIHIAAIMLVGPWGAVLVAAVGVLVVDCLRGCEFRRVAFNTSAFALSALAAGGAYLLAGGVPGHLSLPADLLPIAAMALAYLATNRTLVAAIVSLTSANTFRQLVGEAFRAELASASAEVSLGVALAFFVLSDPWKIVVLGPLVFAVYQAHARLGTLHNETSRALETLANVVDERDPYTYRHSIRVAEYVERLAESLGLPAVEVMRLRWAGRLHDLGKISVEASTLRKQGQLEPEEWELMRRHPRLSARLLLRFRLASAAARAVEYHHERYDGNGYYGASGGEVPLASHFLIVADSYDAMVSDRPYRRGLDRDQALAEIEAGSGTQFHPAVAKAFVALERGQDPLTALTPEEATELRAVSLRLPRPRMLARARPEELAVAGVVTAFAAIGLHHPFAALPGLISAIAATVVTRRREVLRRRLAGALLQTLMEPRSAQGRFRSFVDRLAGATSLGWAGLVRWEDHALSGEFVQQVSLGQAGPQLARLTSWLVREREAAGGLLIARGQELGGTGIYIVAPIAAGGNVSGFVVLAFAGTFGSHVELALQDSLAELEQLLPVTPPQPRLLVATAAS